MIDMRRIRTKRVAAIGGLVVLAVASSVVSAYGVTKSGADVTVSSAPAVMANAPQYAGAATAGPPPSVTAGSATGPSTTPGKSSSSTSSPSGTPTATGSASATAGSGRTATSSGNKNSSNAKAPSTTSKTTSVAPNRPKGALMGVGAADPFTWGTWLGQKVTVGEFWDDARNSSGKITFAEMDKFSSLKTNYSKGKWTGSISLAVPMYSDAENVNSCATTAEIATWSTDLRKAWPSGTVFIRLGWEFNGDWYHWGVQPSQATAFKACWVKWYNLVKAASNRFDLVWNPNNNSASKTLDVRNFWPGSQYVDVAGPDGYALSFSGVLMSTTRTGPLGEPVGINAWLTWIQQKGVPFTVPEWAIRDQAWSSTSPTYIDQMHAAFVTAAKSSTGMAYESYFDGGSQYSCHLSLHATGCAEPSHKAATAEYLKLWHTPYP